MKLLSLQKFVSAIAVEYFPSNPEVGIPNIEPEMVTNVHIGSRACFKLDTSSPHYLSQKWLSENLLKKIPVNNSATAYQPNKSYLDFLEPHIGHDYFLRLDIKSFFHSISQAHIKSSLAPYISDEKFSPKQSLLDACIAIFCYTPPKDWPEKSIANRAILPIGFQTSPLISNIVFRKLDILIQKFCSKSKINYTRYADDMLFSSSNKFLHSDAFLREIQILLNIHQYKLNTQKTLKKISEISLGGYVISEKLRLSNRKLKIIDRLIHMRLSKKFNAKLIMKRLFSFHPPKKIKWIKPGSKFEKEYYEKQLSHKAAGYRSFLISFLHHEKNNNSLQKNFHIKIHKYIYNLEKILLEINP